jgi:hypothetical protein
VTDFVTGERDVNTRIRGLEDAARLAMGNFVPDEGQIAPQALHQSLRVAVIAGGAALAAVVAFAVLQ